MDNSSSQNYFNMPTHVYTLLAIFSISILFLMAERWKQIYPLIFTYICILVAMYYQQIFIILIILIILWAFHYNKELENQKQDYKNRFEKASEELLVQRLNYESKINQLSQQQYQQQRLQQQQPPQKPQPQPQHRQGPNIQNQ